MSSIAKLAVVSVAVVLHFGVSDGYCQPNGRQANQPQRQNRAPASIPTFEQFLTRQDTDRNGKVELSEFQGNPGLFRWLDKDGDGVLTEAEYKARTAGRRNQQRGNRRQLPDGVKAFRDLQYAEVDGQALHLDLYVPENAETPPPLVIWIHGGGWTKGSKENFNPAILRLTGEGYAAASLDYRLEGIVSHPKQIHDCKGAVRWLRANAEKYGYDVTRIGVGGGSAGGHLSLLLGMSNGVQELEGNVGGNLDQSSRVDAIVDLYGPSALNRFAEKSQRFAHGKTAELIRTASPCTYLSADDPPLLILHGDIDKVVPVDQSEYLHQQYQQAGLKSSLHIIEGAGHGGPQFSDDTRQQLIKEFLDRYIKQTPAK